MTTKYKGKKTIDERRAQMKQLLALAEAQKTSFTAEQLAVLTARFDGYSERNALLIAGQRPTATDLSGFYAWHGRGRRVKKGEKGIAIFAPIRTARLVRMATTRPRSDHTSGSRTSSTSSRPSRLPRPAGIAPPD